VTLEHFILVFSGYGKATPTNLNCQHVKNANGFLENASKNVEDFNPDIAHDFAEAILARNYDVAHALLTQKLQLDLSESGLLEMIESHCQRKILAHGYEGFHHPIDFTILTTPIPAHFKNLGSNDHVLEMVTIDFYPSSQLEFEVFFKLNLLLVAIQDADRIASLEIV
jgi:hypothetical protein